MEERYAVTYATMQRINKMCTTCPILREHSSVFHPFVQAWDWGTLGQYYMYRCIYVKIVDDKL
eukprot:12401263-Karenia_brevis.AAC.1